MLVLFSEPWVHFLVPHFQIVWKSERSYEPMEAPRIIFDAAVRQQWTFDEFLAVYPPSRVSQSQASWICVQGIPHVESSNKYADAGDVEGLQRAWGSLLSNTNDRGPTAEHIRRIAQDHHVLSGKWMLFVPRSNIDEVWNRIAAATVNDHLGYGAKVSPKEPANDDGSGDKREPSHLICVYVDDFTDEANVARVRETLRLMGFTRKLSFKADAYTYLDIYSGNEWGIRPSIYYS